MKFKDKLLSASSANNSLLCVGLDPDPKLMPVSDIVEFNRSIVEATYDLVCAYKPNLAFYEALGIEGMLALYKTLEYIPSSIPIIGDAKRGDIGNTAKAYAASLFEDFNFDAVTVNPYLGQDSLLPFLEYKNKGVFVLCRTSNPGSADFQTLMVQGRESRTISGPKTWPLYKEVAAKCQEWNVADNIGLVIGATYPEEAREIRDLCPEMPILMPGIGAQGGALESSVKASLDANHGGLIVNVSRGVIYSSLGDDFALSARTAADKIRKQIELARF